MKEDRGLTGGVSLVGEVGGVGRAGQERAPERAAAQSFLDARHVDMVFQTTILELGGKIAGIDAVSIQVSQHYHQVIVAICTRSATKARETPTAIVTDQRVLSENPDGAGFDGCTVSGKKALEVVLQIAP